MAPVQLLVSFLHFVLFSILSICLIICRTAFFPFRSRKHLLFARAKLQSHSWHLTVFITYKLIDSRTIPYGRPSNKKIKRLSTIKMRCSTRDEIIFGKNVDREKKWELSTGFLYLIHRPNLCAVPPNQRRAKRHEKKKRTCRLSAEIKWTIILTIMFVFERNSSKKYSIFVSSHTENQV